MAQASTRIGIVGGGAWGTALATAARRAAREVVVWAREVEVVADINGNHRNTAFLPGIELDPAIEATASLAGLRDCGLVLLVTPAQYVRAIGADLAGALAPDTPVVICAKSCSAAVRPISYTGKLTVVIFGRKICVKSRLS